MSRAHSRYSASKVSVDVLGGVAMLRAALMRLLRRRGMIITLSSLAVGSAAIAAPPIAAETRDPWATVNVCDTADFPDTIGIRASMPGSRSGKEERYMRFIVQYFSRADDRWYNVAAGGDSGYLSIGSGRRARQFGRSFRLEPPAGRSVLLRGRVFFQWRV
jgi:hypothetical protein